MIWNYDLSINTIEFNLKMNDLGVILDFNTLNCKYKSTGAL